MTGPLMSLDLRYSQMACVIAAMWASVNVPSSDVPRCPLVPNETSWVLFETSGLRS
jgi:hypothetical protein